MRFMCGSFFLGGMIAMAGGCTDVPPATDARPPQEETPPGADIAPENLPYATENEAVSSEPAIPNEGTGLVPSRFQELDENPSPEFPQREEQPQENSPNLLESSEDDTSRSDVLEPSDDLAFPADAIR